MGPLFSAKKSTLCFRQCCQYPEKSARITNNNWRIDMFQVTDVLLKKMTDLIVKEIAPQKVILFGSHARGTARPDSDLDFMVIEDCPFGPDKTRENEMVKL
jgi:predicted nucleotidyltransferase